MWKPTDCKQRENLSIRETQRGVIDSWQLAKQWQPNHQSFQIICKISASTCLLRLTLHRSEKDKQYLTVHLKTNLFNLTPKISFINPALQSLIAWWAVPLTCVMTTGLTASIIIFGSFCHPNIWCWCIPFILPANTQFPTPKWKHLRNANLKRRCAALLPPSWLVKVLLPFDCYYNTCEAMQSDYFALLTFWLSLSLSYWFIEWVGE